MEKLNNIKVNLVEKLGVHMEKRGQIAPVAARILAYVVLTGKKGTTFEDLVSNLCASKSTISTHLNHLQDLKRLNYFTKPGDRKKYFIINTETMIKDISDLIDEWKDEQELHIEIMNYKIEANKTLEKDNKFDCHIHENFIEFHNEAIKSISKLKETIVEHKQLIKH
ncbi:MAG: GbsR/MarR family transcriptional regulator [Aestuariibaculum sp.]